MLKKECCFTHASSEYKHATSKFTKKSECFCTYRTKRLYSDWYENTKAPQGHWRAWQSAKPRRRTTATRIIIFIFLGGDNMKQWLGHTVRRCYRKLSRFILLRCCCKEMINVIFDYRLVPSTLFACSSIQWKL